ncbi:O-antigen polymerase [Rhodoferax sp. UBA5149]|uniref:O-antigen polymerase n=1 Tax=Rhodoferax sp. UBA5149 TaxID=1947379 RepID=UPI0025F82C17|nr:O-antigen polymerase [Rhodoferax sp. UBA5149]
MAEKLLAILFSLLILVQAGLVRRLVGTWIFPACLFGLFWFALTFIPLVVLFSVPIEWTAVAYIFLCCLLFSATALSIDWHKAYAVNRKRSNRSNFGGSFMRLAFFGTTLLTLLFLVINTAAQGFSLNDIVFDIMQTANSYIARRYNDELDVNLFGKLSVVFTYTSAIIGGMYYNDRPQKVRGSIILLLVLVPSAAVMVIQGAKGTLFLAIAYFIAGVLISKIRKNDLTFIRKENVVTILIYILLIIPVLTMSFLARGLFESDDLVVIKTELTRSFLSYSSAHMYAFSDWFSHLMFGESVVNYSDDFSEYGFHTFMSIFKLFGSDKYVPAGYYDEYFYYGEIIQTNIFTMFRGLIYDFGLIGSLAFMIGFGLFCHVSFFQLLVSPNPTVSASVFAHLIGFIYTSFLISQFVWNSIYVTFILIIILVYINNYLNKIIGPTDISLA